MPNPYAMFETDASLEENGRNLDFGDFIIKVARSGGSNKRYKARLDQALRPYRRQIASNTLDKDLADQILIRVFAETIVLGWENVCDREGTPIPYTKENVIKLLTELPNLFKELLEQSTEMSNFLAQEIEEDAKK